MGGTKIIVLKLRQIIKSFLLTLGGLILIALLIILFLPKKDAENSGIYNPGSYYSQVMLQGKPIKIEVTVDQNKILRLKLNDINNTQKILYPLVQSTMQNLAHQVVQYQSGDIPVSSNYPITEKFLLNAVQDALAQAKNNNSQALKNKTRDLNLTCDSVYF